MARMPTILCIDDQEASLLIRAKLLELYGYNVITATTGSSALKVVSEQQVDLAVLDYRIPGGPSGEEIAKEIRALHPRLPLLMLTGYPEVPQSARDSVDVCLIKGAEPVTTLLSLIEKLLSENGGSDGCR